MIYTFDDYTVDPVKRLVLKEGGEPILLKPKAFDALLYLVENADRVVEREELMNALWYDTVVEENNLTQHISALRRIFRETPSQHRYIATVPGRGYKFVANVVTAETDKSEVEEAASSPVADHQSFWQRRPFLVAAGVCVIAILTTTGFLIWRSETGSQGEIRSIAVLPFKPVVATSRDEALEMGMADTLISKLGSRDDVIIRPLSAVRRFGSPEQDAIEAGRLLGVDAVLDGSVQIVGDRVRVSTRLLSVKESKQLWTQQFDERLTDIFTVQDSIAERVATALRLGPGKNTNRRYTDNPEAYRLYLLGRFHNQKLTPADSYKALAHFQQAIDIDPNYALAYAGVSEVYRTLALSGEEPPAASFERSIAAAERAIAIDDDLAEGYTALGISKFWHTRDWVAAENALRRSVELDPSWSTTHIYCAHLLSNIGRHSEALANAKRARELDPVSPFITTLEGVVLLQAGQPDNAMQQFTSASEIDPNFWMPHMFASRAYIEKGMFDEAWQSANRASKLSPAQTISISYEIYALAKLGRREEANTLLDALEKRSQERYVMPYHLAIAYMGLGDREKTLTWLEKGLAENDPKMAFLKVEHAWDEIRSEPRFIELMRKMNF